MKICFITTGNIKYIATSKRAFGMANPLSNLGWDVHLLIEDVEENRKRSLMECNENVTVHYFPKGNALAELKSKNTILKSIKPDVIYLCAFVFRNIVRKYGAKALSEHSELQSAIQDLKVIKRYQVKFLENYSILYSDGVLCASKYLEKFFIQKANKYHSKINVMHFPYAYSKELYKALPDELLTNNFISLKDKINFVYLGTITNNYGAKLMVTAFDTLLKTHSNIRLIMLGRGRHYDETLALVKEKGMDEGILMPGFIEEEDIERYFSVADAFISPMNDTIQDWARCPSKLYMYLPYKKPIFTCKIGEPYEVLKDDGKYFLTGSADNLAETIKDFLENDTTSSTVNPDLHTWEQRTMEFDQWTKKVI